MRWACLDGNMTVGRYTTSYPQKEKPRGIAALEGAVLPPGSGDPVAFGGILLLEAIFVGRGQLRDLATTLGGLFIGLQRVRLLWCLEARFGALYGVFP